MYGRPITLTTTHIGSVPESRTKANTIIQLIVEQQRIFDKRILAQQLHCSLSNDEPSSPDGSEFASLTVRSSLAANITYFAIALESQHYSLFL